MPSTKEAMIIPLPKQGKPPNNAESYRPISLLPCLAKTMEKMVAARLEYELEMKEKLRCTQGGFRKRFSTLHQISILESKIKTALCTKQICITVFFDLTQAYDKVWRMGLLYKLVQMGIRGHMLGWLREYLSDRKFSVFYEGENSEYREANSGLPQGSALSPLLFNVMTADMPKLHGVTSIEYADDFAFCVSGRDLKQTNEKMQDAVNQLYEWTRRWGLEINHNKTKAMMFTLKKVSKPSLLLNDSEIAFVNDHKYLGMTLDAPKLNWKSHIDKLKSRCIPRMNILSAVSHYAWGADRRTLYSLYKALVRSTLDYGSIFYDTASDGNLKKLDAIQNKCLRIITGARKTSPIAALEAEANIPPLRMHRKSLLIKFHCGVSELPEWDLHDEIFKQPLNQTVNRRTNGPNLPLHARIKQVYRQLSMKPILPTPAGILSPCPPWVDLEKYFIEDFMSLNKSMANEEAVNQIFQDVAETRYHKFLEIYTDGSKFVKPDSTTAAYVVEDLEIEKSWLLPGYMSILDAELYAINKAIEQVCQIHSCLSEYRGAVIYTDSLSVIKLLQNRSPPSNRHTVFNIQNTLLQIIRFLRLELKVQWIPGHMDIKGNERVDLMAKAAHNLEVSTWNKKTTRVIMREMKNELAKMWENKWKENADILNKGKHLTQIRESLGYWEWAENKSRRIETAMARLRLGHVGLNKHLHRFNMALSEDCVCGEVETVSHYLLECPLYEQLRAAMRIKLLPHNVECNLKNLLGGGNFSSSTQNTIVRVVALYLQGTGRLNQL